MRPEESVESVPLSTRVIAYLIYLVILVFGLTYRIRIVGRSSNLRGLVDRGDSVLIACWHNRMFYFATYLISYLRPCGYKLSILSSISDDGEIGATVGKFAGARVARGSSSRRGALGFRGLYRSIVKDKFSIILLPDGSKGPVYKAKVGVVALSKMTGKPILPISCWASSYWRIRSWDRMIFPKPFAKIVVTVGDFLDVPRSADEEALEGYRFDLEQRMDNLGFQAVDQLNESCVVV